MKLLALGWTLIVLIACGAPVACADEFDEEQARAIESLHAFGVRGLPDAFKHAAAGASRGQAIDLGLAWLAAHQTPDGSWRPAQLEWCNGKKRPPGGTGKGKDLYEGGITGMAVTAFLGAGYTHRGNHPYAAAVRKAIQWLVGKQDDDGCIGPRQTQQYVYNHAFSALALVEAYALTGDPKLRIPAQRAIDFSALARNPYFAWRYGIKPGDNDTSVTGCMGLPMYTALRLNRAGERAHVFEPLGLDDSAFDGIRNWFDKVVDKQYGSAGYIMRGTGPARPMEFVDKFPGDKSEAPTAITVFLRQVLPGFETTREDAKENKELIAKGVKLMLNLKPAWTVGAGNIDFYYWYYATMAMRQVGGEAWLQWDDALATALLNHQRRDGDVCDFKGSWDPEGVWAKADGGRIYATAICLLMLETPDRMRPLPDDRSDLLDALQAKDLTPERRASILRGLGMLGVPKAGAAVSKWVGDDDEQICAAAASALGRLDAGRKGVRVLARLLEDKRVLVRREVVKALAHQGTHLKPIIDQLLKRMGDEDLQVAAGAARVLGHCGVPEVAATLKQKMSQGDIALRVAVAGAVYRLSDDVAGTLPVLTEGLKAKSERVRVEAAETFAAMPSGFGPAQPALLEALKDPSARVRVFAAGTLHRTGKEQAACIHALITALDAPAGVDRLLAMRVLEGAGGSPRATQKLAKQLLTGATSLRTQAAITLRVAGHGARAAAPALSWCSANGPNALRKAASDAYDALEIGPAEAVTYLLPAFDEKAPDARILDGASRALVFQGQAVVPALVDKLATGSQPIKRWMLSILRRMGRAAAQAVPAIARVLRAAESDRSMWYAARALGAIGPQAVKALPDLEKALAHEKEYVAMAALQAIGKLAPGSPQAVQLLVTMAKDRDKKKGRMRIEALTALGQLRDHVDRVIPTLFQTLSDTGYQVRETAIDALVSLWPECESYLGKALGEAGPKVRVGVATAIERVGAPAKKLVKPLAKVLDNGNFSGRTKYADALGAIGKPSVRALTKLLRHKVSAVRSEAARGLGIVGPDAKRALSALRKLLSDPDIGVQMAARSAIDKIKKK